ncbi:MAG: hypothetical protein ABI893_15400 [Polaromonas sp.]|uniref:hypothetical protein n=1 Tax=Polaromonas sp. TaxID=1869339 RepID=UPI003267EE08
MQLHKTDRARAELKPGVRTLGQRERTLLLMADGSKSAQDFRPLFDGDGEAIALRLLREGFLEAHPGKMPAPAAVPKSAPDPKPTPAQLQNFPSPETTQAIRVSADQFEGKRSLATTRMFLFDICERMFARRDPVMAERFREALRNAKDRETMLTASREMIEEIEKIAGHERADSISERIAMLLPQHQAA